MPPPTPPPARPDAAVNIVFIGCGLATRMHSRTLARFPRVRRYYASRDVGRAEEYNRRYSGNGFFGSYKAAFANGGIDVALIVTPPASHLDLTLEALNSRKHVIVEKPPFRQSSDFDIVAQAKQKAARQVFVAENYFYKPLAFRLREILASDAIGEVRFLHFNALKHQRTGDWRDDAALAGGGGASGAGALFEGGIHWINFIANLGLRIESITGFVADARQRPGGERSVLVVAQYENGAVGTLSFSWDIPSPFRGVRISRIYGTNGSIAFESNGLFLVLLGKKTRLIFPGVRDMLGYRAMFRDFLAALRNEREALFDFALARRDMELVEKAYASMKLPRGVTHA